MIIIYCINNLINRISTNFNNIVISTYNRQSGVVPLQNSEDWPKGPLQDPGASRRLAP